MPDMDKLYTALRNADAAGDTDAARKLASHIQSLRSAPAAAPVKAPSALEKFGRGLRDPLDGGAQLLTNLLPKGVVDAGNRANNWLADKTGLVARLPEGGVDQQVRDSNRDYEARRKAAGEDGFDGYRFLGGLLPSTALTLSTGGLAAGAGLAGRVGLGAAQGAVQGALTPSTSKDDYWSDKAQQVGLGAGLGAAIPAALGAAARVVSPNASKNASVALLRREGVTPTIGQTLGGSAARTEEKLMSVPIVGDSIRAARGRANTQFQTAAFNRALAPVGEELPAGLSGREAVDYTEGLLRQRYDDVLTNIGAIPADQQFGSSLSSLGSMVNRDFLSPAAKAKFGDILSGVQSMFGQGGALTSEGFKRIESQLGSDYRALTSSRDVYDGRLAPAVKQLQQELRDLLQRQAGQNADELQAVNAGWANFKRAQGAAGRVGAEAGDFTPAQFQSAVRGLDKSKDKGAFARGSALGQDLGDAGKSVLTGKVPDSGTPGRAFLGLGALGSSYLVDPALAAGVLGGAAAYLPLSQRLLVAAAASRPAAAQPAANALRKASPVFLPGALQLGLQGSE